MMAESDDLLWQHLKTVPSFRALLRSVEARLYQHLEIPAPTLDLGCGDGHFASLTFNRPLDAGIDPWRGPLEKAAKTGSYNLLVQSQGDQLPYPSDHFSSVISNSVLEHIPHLDPVLREANRVLKPDGKFIFTVPNHLFTKELAGAQWFERLGLGWMANWYRRIFNKIARHAHTDPPEKWAARLAGAGFAIERWQYYFSVGALHALELGHFQGLPSAIIHFLTGHWIVAPWYGSLWPTERWVRPYFEEQASDKGTMLLIVARKKAVHAIKPELPPAQPINLANGVEQTIGRKQVSLTPTNEPSKSVSFEIPENIDDVAHDVGASSTSFVTVNAGLIILVIGSAAIGQIVLNSKSGTFIRAIPWWGISFAMLFALSWRLAHRNAPHFLQMILGEEHKISRRRLLIFPGFLLSAVAYQLASAQDGSPSPLWAFILWVTAILLSLYGLWEFRPATIRAVQDLHLKRKDLAILAMLFVLAFSIRLVSLGSHPFILSGTEASIGLDSAAAAAGELKNPFASGWLTNPTLPSFLLAIPLKALGNTVLAIRILSPFVGAMTVAALYILGRRLFSPLVGLVAALLLTASHTHVHYSRIGMTNIWDPLLTLTAIALIYVAWQRRSRQCWLAAGVLSGLNAYFYTSSHLFPLILLGLTIPLLIEWRDTWPQRFDMLAAGAMALVVSLPQLIYYRLNEAVFWDRVNTLGIFQSGWLVDESTRSGDRISTILFNQMVRGLLSYNTGLDSSNAYNPGISLLTFALSVFLLIGIGLATWRLRQLRFSFLLIWIAVTVIFGGALLISPPSSHRLLIGLPAVYLLAALALLWLIQQVVDIAKIGRRYLSLLVIISAITISVVDLSFYFGVYRAQHRYGDRNTEIAFEITSYLNNLEGDWTAFFHGPPTMYASFPTFSYLMGNGGSQIDLVDVVESNAMPKAILPGNIVHLYLPERSSEIEQILAEFPQGQLITFSGHHANPLFYAYETQPAP